MNTEKLLTPADRLKHLRAILRVSRSYFQEKHGIPEVTLKSWENGTTKLSQIGAARCVEAYLKEGLIVGVDWILEGAGLDPRETDKVSKYFAQPTTSEYPIDDDEYLMIRDAEHFKNNNPNSVILIVSNDDMRPTYKPGDYVGGKIKKGEDIALAVNKDCIVHLENGERFFRRLVKNSKGNFNLTCLNPNESTTEPVLYNVDIVEAAPIIWHRWKDC